MAQYTLTMLDTSGIQSYIFNSNRLQENIGASELVYRATTLWAFKALEKLKHNIEFDDHVWNYTDSQFEKDNLDAEVIYAGGGNTFILFRDGEQARQTTGRLTRSILKDAPSLTVVAQHTPFEWGADDLKKKREELLQSLAAHKQSRQPSVPILGLGVSAVCQSTGLPAIQSNENLRLSVEEEIRLISRETRAKLGMVKPSNARLREALDSDFPYDVDKLGRIEGDESYVAVVHADGNRMGEHLNAAVPAGTDARAAITALRQFSKNVNAAGLAALRQVVQLTAQAVDDDRVPHEEDYLPLRPLVFGGDDLTLLCNGQIGVSLAAAYLKAFEEETAKLKMNMRARAGVAIVKMHYPFARAYALSEELAKSAKHFIKNETNGDCSALDWHYATGGLSGELDLIREREYTNKRGKPLTLRPVRLDQGDQKDTGRYWRDGLESAILKFKNDPYWSKRKNKVVGMREPLRKGPQEVVTYFRNFEIKISKLPELATANARETGWLDDRCLYFDAVELFDQYRPLEKEA